MDHLCLTDEQFGRIVPLLPNDKREKERLDNRHVISGIVHVLRSEGRWTDAPCEIYGPKRRPSTVASRAGLPMASGPRCSRRWLELARRPFRGRSISPSSRLTAVPWEAKGGAELSHRSLAGRAHYQDQRSTDRFCRLLAFLLTGGQAADFKAGALLLERLPTCRIALADMDYDSDAIWRRIEAPGATPNTPPEINRRWKPCFSSMLYRRRNAIERMFGRLKNFRRIATGYNRLAPIYLAAVCLAAISYCL